MARPAMTNRTPVRDRSGAHCFVLTILADKRLVQRSKETWTSIGIDANKARCSRPNSRNRTKDPEGKDPCPKEGPEGEGPKTIIESYGSAACSTAGLSARCLLSAKVDADWA